jgi:hypothetical protein
MVILTLKHTIMTQLALQPAKSRKNYYVNLYMGKATYENRRLFTPFYSEDYASEAEAKQAAIKEFLRTNGGLDFYSTVTLTEHNGMQIADKNEPYSSKSAIVRVLASKKVKVVELM